jgi:hypothetical protein
MRRIAVVLLLGLPSACGAPAPGSAPSEANLEVGADEHRYQLPAAQVWTAVQSAVSEDAAAVEVRRPASDGGEIVVRRFEGPQVTATVAAVDRNAARVSVVVSPPNAALAAMIQARIGERLSLQKARADLFGESSVENVYERSLESCVLAVEETCRALDLEIVRRMTVEENTRIVARDRSGLAIGFSLRPIGQGGVETAVLFTVESSGNGEDATDRLRREFERRLFPGRE